MPLDRKQLAQDWKLAVRLRSPSRLLVQLFPPENVDSPKMWRLAIVRDDIDWECDSMREATARAAINGDPEAHWQFAYYLRRLSVSMLEAKRIFDAGDSGSDGITRKLKLQARLHPHRREFYQAIVRLTTKLAKVERLLLPIRNSIGAHVRPNDANPDKATESYEVRGLRAHGGHRGEIHLNKASAFGTSYREFTRLAPFFCWPEVVDSESLQRKLPEFIQPVVETTRHVIAGIDAVLYAFWLDIRAFPPRT
jgi:hypothetical protein